MRIWIVAVAVLVAGCNSSADDPAPGNPSHADGGAAGGVGGGGAGGEGGAGAGGEEDVGGQGGFSWLDDDSLWRETSATSEAANARVHESLPGTLRYPPLQWTDRKSVV